VPPTLAVLAVIPMAKPRTQKQIDTDFVQAVGDIRRFYISKDDADPDQPVGTSEAFASLDKQDQHDARAVATALIVFANRLGGKDTRHVSQLQQAWYSLHLFDAIVCGTPGPFFCYILNVRKSGRRAADYATQQRRGFFVGLVLALEKATLLDNPRRKRRMTRPAAVKEANKLCRLSFTSAAVNKWIERGQVSQFTAWYDRIVWTSSGELDGRTFIKRVKDNGLELLATLDAVPEPLPFGQ
jgi:hypothetical protein